MNKTIAEKLKMLPAVAGVYVMRNSNGEVIYVGKAKRLKNRVSQYFQNSNKPDKVMAMVKNIADLDWYVCKSERDALALENNLIKENQPFYNILLKDSKTFPYIKINTNEPFPHFEITRLINSKNAHYFGPFISGIRPRELLKVISLAFPIRTCSQNVGTKTIKRECLNYHLGLCSAPCTKKIGPEDYSKLVKKATDFLNGNNKVILNILKDKMEKSAKAENFERALELRDAIKMVEALGQKVIANLPKDISLDAFAYSSDGFSGAVAHLSVRGGKMMGINAISVIDASLCVGDALSSFIMQYYDHAVPPEQILVLDNLPMQEELQFLLRDKFKQKVNIICPRKGIKYGLVKMAEDNASEHIKRNTESTKRKLENSLGAINRLASALNLKSPPKRLECYDISNINGTLKVASMVVFTNGEPDRKAYRKFKIKTVAGQDDFASLQEALSRRLNELRNGTHAFLPAPDLIVIDGGKGQLSSVCEILKAQNFNLPICSLAKQFEEVYLPNKSQPIMLKRGSAELKLLQRLRDEAHRFAITFHRNLRTKKMLSSELMNIKGLGEMKQEALLKAFGTSDRIATCSKDELCLVKGIYPFLAESIVKYFNDKNSKQDK